MISWLSWGRTLKNLSKPLSRIFLPILLFLLIGLFWFFRPLSSGSLNTLFALFLFFGSLYLYIKRQRESLEFLVFLSLFLGFLALYNFQFAFFIPAWISEILVFIFTFALFTYLASQKGYLPNSLLFSVGLSICLLEVFFVLSFWPTNPLSKSFILTSLFYAFWFIVVKKEKILSYLVLVSFALILVLVTTNWPVI